LRAGREVEEVEAEEGAAVEDEARAEAERLKLEGMGLRAEGRKG
jgi:hypothetical protein